MSDTDKTPPTAEHEGSSLAFETMIADLSSRFINLVPIEVDREIQDALRRVCELLGIDLAVLWQWSTADPDVITPTHTYDSMGGPPPPERLYQEQFPWIRQQIAAGRMVAAASLEELPTVAAVDRQNGRRLGIKSSLTVPLSVGGAPSVGALAFNTIRAHRDWPDPMVKRLELVAQVFTNALARRRADDALRESEERLAMAADAAEAGLWGLDQATNVFWVTERTRSIFGYGPDEVVDVDSFMAVVHPDDRDLVQAAMERATRVPEPVIVEYRIRPAESPPRWVVSRGRSHVAATGEPGRLMGVSIDISARRRAQEALLASEARLEAGVELAGLAFYEVDFGEGIAFVDDRLRDLCGIPSKRELGLQAVEFWMDHIHPDDRPRVLDERRQLHEGILQRLSIEYRYLHPRQGQKWFQHVSVVVRQNAEGRAVKTFGVLRDITERKRGEEDLRELSRRLIGAHEEERALLARELHDDVTQRLAVLAIDAGRAELVAADGAQAETMQRIRKGLMSLSEDIHSLAYQLHPSVLEELGLVEALRAECERRGRQGLLDLSLDLDPLPIVIGADAALCLFRVAQEALNNVGRHALVRSASVTLRQMDEGLLLAVSDRGAGFDPQSRDRGMSLGLAGMRERVRLVHGTLEIESAPGQGTTILAWVPADGESR